MSSEMGFSIVCSSKAIAMALQLRKGTCTQPPCFKVASVTKLPYDDASFDLGLSADMLEHIAPEDVPQAVTGIHGGMQNIGDRFYDFPQRVKYFDECHCNPFDVFYLAVACPVPSMWIADAFLLFHHVFQFLQTIAVWTAIVTIRCLSTVLPTKYNVRQPLVQSEI
eukprot:3021008-Amphidinium_carterae.1